MSLKTIQNRRFEISTDSESDDSDDEHLTNDRQIYTEPQHEASFLGKRKGPQHEGQTVIKLSDPAIDRQSNFRYYRLMNTSHVRLGGDSRKLRKQVNTFQATFEKNKFKEENANMVIDFLTAFVEEANTFDVSKAHAFPIMPKMLKSRVKCIYG